jgi:hypothetical protein
LIIKSRPFPLCPLIHRIEMRRPVVGSERQRYQTM